MPPRLRSHARRDAAAATPPPPDKWHPPPGETSSYYCEGRLKPLLRGKLHALTAVTAPLWCGYQLKLCRSTEATIATSISLFAAVWLFCSSGAFHNIRWTTREQELFFGKLDYVGIFLQVGFSISPFYALLLPSSLGWWVIVGLALTVGAGAFMIVVDPPWARSRHTLVAVYIAQFALQLLPLLYGGSESSIVSKLQPYELSLFALCLASYGCGSQCYAYGSPALWPSVFGYHELWHVLVVLGSACTFLANCSLVMRI